MADEKDQHSEDPNSESNYRSSDDKLTEELKKEKLKRKAFYSVLLAFRAETFTIGNKRTHLIEKLMKELNISQETLISFDNNILENLIAHHQRVISELKEAKAKPLTISLRKPPLVPTYVDTPSSIWGRVNPQALVGRRVSVRMCSEEEFEDFVIKEYNAKDEIHHLESVDPDAMEMDEVSSWIDFREVPTDDIIWRDGEAPNF
ncbi:ENT domain-containing protein [Hirschfeldia incana]|nr:ENT domain-containing protein [Hirschfeldia incana]